MRTSLKLYDALVQAKVPNEVAEAVVEALETELTATLLTKSEFEAFRTGEFGGLRNDFEAFRTGEFAGLRNDFEAFRAETRTEFKAVRTEIAAVRNDIEAVHKEVTAQPYRLMLWLGGTVVVSAIGIVAALVNLQHLH